MAPACRALIPPPIAAQPLSVNLQIERPHLLWRLTCQLMPHVHDARTSSR